MLAGVAHHAHEDAVGRPRHRRREDLRLPRCDSREDLQPTARTCTCTACSLIDARVHCVPIAYAFAAVVMGAILFAALLGNVTALVQTFDKGNAQKRTHAHVGGGLAGLGSAAAQGRADGRGAHRTGCWSGPIRTLSAQCMVAPYHSTSARTALRRVSTLLPEHARHLAPKLESQHYRLLYGKDVTFAASPSAGAWGAPNQ